MKASFVDLRKKSSEIIKALGRNERITVLYRGKPAAIMQSIDEQRDASVGSAREHTAFGLWADRDDMNDAAAHVRQLRRGRFDDL